MSLPRWLSPIILAAIVSALVTFVLFNLLAPAAGVDTQPVTTVEKAPVEVVAREPGIAYDALKFCDDPTTRVRLGPPMEDGGTNYIAERGSESVDYKDSVGGLNPMARHYAISPSGAQISEPVELSQKAAECIRKKLPR